MKTVTTINGRLVSRKDEKISVFDNTLLYAEGLFETCLCVDDNIVFLKEHLRRLRRGVKVTDFLLPVDDTTLSRWMHKTVRSHPARIKQLRLTLTAGESARYVGRQGKQVYRFVRAKSMYQCWSQTPKSDKSCYRSNE